MQDVSIVALSRLQAPCWDWENVRRGKRTDGASRCRGRGRHVENACQSGRKAVYPSTHDHPRIPDASVILSILPAEASSSVFVAIAQMDGLMRSVIGFAHATARETTELACTTLLAGIAGCFICQL